MKILLCPDKFKGSISAEDVCAALTTGLLSADDSLQIVSRPMADGGDGSIDILKSLLRLDRLTVQTTDPMGRNIVAEYYHSTEAAFIELASASGLVLLTEAERNPQLTSSRGTGLMIKDAMERGFQKIYLFIGGSATNDGGIGIAQALGYHFLDEHGAPLEPIGSSLLNIRKIVNNSAQSIDNLDITVLCDVTNPMHGSNGAAHIYAAQKGASTKDVLSLDEGLRNFASILEGQGHGDLSTMQGMGAAGAVSASLVGLLQAQMKNGFQMLADVTNLEDAIKDADLVITGEGKVDGTSFQGKVVGNVLLLCKKHKTQCGVIGGMIEEVSGLNSDILFKKAVISLANSLSDAMSSPERFLIAIGKQVVEEHISML